MVNRRWTYGAAALIGFFLLALGWLLLTPTGSRFLLTGVARLAGADLSAESLTGSLAGELTLQNVRITWKGGEALLEQVSAAWQPGSLLQGRLQVKKLLLRGVEVHAVPGEKPSGGGPPELAFPAPERIPFLPVTVDTFVLEDFLLRRPGKAPWVVERLATRIFWDRPRVRLEDFDLRLPAASISGSGGADLAAPALALDLSAVPAGPAGFREAALQVSLQPAAGSRRLAGPVTVRIAGDKTGVLAGSGRFDWSPERLLLDPLTVRQEGTGGELDGRLVVTRSGRFEVLLRGEKIDLQFVTGMRTELAGEVRGAGTVEKFEGEFVLANRAAGWHAFRLSGPFSADRSSLSLPEFAGTWLDGRLQGEARAEWGRLPQLRLNVRGERLDPARITPDWPGRIRFTLEASARFPHDGPPEGAIDAELLDSRLRGYPLTGAVRGSFAGEELEIDRLDLRGEGFDLFARGRLQDRIDFRFDVARLSALVPKAAGRARGEGWGRWEDGHVSGKVTAAGSDIAVAGLALRRFRVEAERPAAGGPFRLAAEIRSLSHPRLQLARASFQAQGLPQRHTFSLTAAGPELTLQATAAGGYAGGSWSGTLERFSAVTGRFGRWRLGEATRLQVAADTVRIEPFRLAGSDGGLVQGEADLGLRPLRGSARARWESLDLALANLLLAEGTAVRGRSSGTADLHWQDEQHFDLDAQLEASGSLTAGGERLDIRRLAVETAWGAAGLQGKLDLALVQGGFLAGTVSSAEPAHPGLPASGDASLRWQELNLALFSPWLPDVELAGKGSGRLQVKWSAAGEQMTAAGQLEAAGRVGYRDLSLRIRRAVVDLDWSAAGLKASWQLQTGETGVVRGTISSPEPARAGPPRQGKVMAQWQGIDLALLRPWLPSQVLLEGGLGGRLEGEWQDGWTFDLGGSLAISGGELQWGAEEGVITASLRQAELGWRWRQETLSGEISLLLADYGRARGTFTLPVPAKLPVRIAEAAAVRGELQGSLQEAGLLTALFPGLVQETSGRLAFDLRLGGTWRVPDLGGEVRLEEAGAYLPSAGIRLEKMAVFARLEGETLRIESFRLGSGPGRIEGSAVVRLAGWRLQGYSVTLRGERFELVDLPELQLLVNPDLTIEGDRQNLKVRGEIVLPEVLVRGRGAEQPIEPSPDVVLVGAPAPAKKRRLPVDLDIRVRLVLGDHVLVDAEGLDARLEGGVRLTVLGLEPEAITAQGEIRVAEGHYSTYGVRLRIVRGTILFAGGPVDRPTLDILALRTAGEVKAGVRVRGTPRQPEVSLYAEPSMPDTDILSYIVLGHPLGQGDGNAGLLLSAAGALLSKGESAVLQDRLKRQLGLDVLELQAGDGDVTGSTITIGKYLNPDLYISFGRSLFTESSTVRLRYNLGKRWQLESSVGDQGAVDLYYKIEFR